MEYSIRKTSLLFRALRNSSGLPRTMHKPAEHPNELERLFVERANDGDLDGLVALYEAEAVIVDGRGTVAVGRAQIRDLLAGFLASRPRLPPSDQAPPLQSGDIALTSSHLSNGDVTAEVARRQRAGNWLWVVDNFALTRGAG